MGNHGGGAFSGKDPSKVDRSGAYMARYVAKNIVAAGLAGTCEVQIAYAIGVAEPVSVLVTTGGTGVVPDDVLTKAVREVFDLRPYFIIKRLDLHPAHLQEERLLRPLRPRGFRLPLGSDRCHCGPEDRRQNLGQSRFTMRGGREHLFRPVLFAGALDRTCREGQEKPCPRPHTNPPQVRPPTPF
jgi:hypothetical protein